MRKHDFDEDGYCTKCDCDMGTPDAQLPCDGGGGWKVWAVYAMALASLAMSGGTLMGWW